MSEARAGAERVRLPQLIGEPRLRAVLFDAGLTLIRVATPLPDLAVALLESEGEAFGRGDIDEAMAASESVIEATWRQGDWFASEDGVRRLFVSGFARGLAALPGLADRTDAAGRYAEAMYDEYQSARHWEPFPDVAETLEELRVAEVQMGVVSDWGHGLEAILLELGLGRYFSFLVISSRLGVSKPDPAVFQMALRRIDVPASAAIYVGDTYVKDVLGARAAGLTPVLIDRHGNAPAVDCVVIRSLSELPALTGVR